MVVYNFLDVRSANLKLQHSFFRLNLLNIYIGNKKDYNDAPDCGYSNFGRVILKFLKGSKIVYCDSDYYDGRILRGGN